MSQSEKAMPINNNGNEAASAALMVFVPPPAPAAPPNPVEEAKYAYKIANQKLATATEMVAAAKEEVSQASREITKALKAAKQSRNPPPVKQQGFKAKYNNNQHLCHGGRGGGRGGRGGRGHGGTSRYKHMETIYKESGITIYHSYY